MTRQCIGGDLGRVPDPFLKASQAENLSSGDLNHKHSNLKQTKIRSSVIFLPQPSLLNAFQGPNKTSEKENRDERTEESDIANQLQSSKRKGGLYQDEGNKPWIICDEEDIGQHKFSKPDC